MKQGDVHMAIHITKTIFQVTENCKNNNQNVKSWLKRFAERLSAKNNYLLEKNQSIIDGKHRILPYKINKKLERLQNQPDFILAGKYDESWQIEDRKDLIFFDSCNKRSLISGKNSNSGMSCPSV